MVGVAWAVFRVVPHPCTGEGVAVGVVLHSREAEYLGFRAVTDPDRLRELAPDADTELLVRYLRSCEAIARGADEGGEIALLSKPERFHWLSAPRSDVIQPSEREYGTAEHPAELLESLFRERVPEAD